MTTPNAHALDPRDLRTVPMPDLRTAEARTRDAHARGLDCRTFDEQVIAELVRLVDALQLLTLKVEELERVQTVTIAGLEAYIRDHSEADDEPLALAEDAWGGWDDHTAAVGN